MTNVNLAAIADELGRLNAAADQLESQISALKAQIKASGLDEIEGSNFTVTQSKSIRQTLDTASVKKEMGQSWFDDRSKLAEVVTVRIKAKAKVSITVIG